MFAYSVDQQWREDVWPPYASQLTIEIVLHKGGGTSKRNTSWPPRNMHTSMVALGSTPDVHVEERSTQNAGLRGSGGVRRFVRVIYNNEDMIVDGCSSVWCPYARFVEQLQRHSMSQQEYKMKCRNP